MQDERLTDSAANPARPAFGLDPFERSVAAYNEIIAGTKPWVIPLYVFGWLLSFATQAYMLMTLEPSLEMFRMMLLVNASFALLPWLSSGLGFLGVVLKTWK